jgi:hypothetical protein
MDKGIRPACNAKFLELLPARVNTREGNCAFRKSVMASVMEDFGITLASAATHYNHAFKHAVSLNTPGLDGLGRPEDKKGGRKPKAKPEAVTATPPNFFPVGGFLVSQGIKENTSTHTVTVNPAADELTPEGGEQTVFVVRKKADDSVVAEGLSFEDARELVNKAAAQKKAKLYWV